jgi:hypothetical protein
LRRRRLGDDSIGVRGVQNHAISIYFLDATLAGAFVARWCAGSRIETEGGVFRISRRRAGAADRGGAASNVLRFQRTPGCIIETLLEIDCSRPNCSRFRPDGRGADAIHRQRSRPRSSATLSAAMGRIKQRSPACIARTIPSGTGSTSPRPPSRRSAATMPRTSWLASAVWACFPAETGGCIIR